LTPAGKPSRPLRDEITDLPNLLTLARIAAIPAVLVCVDNYSPRLSFLAALIFVAAMVTDVVDGWLARRMGLVTVLGKFLDPLADKLMVLSVLVIMVARDRAPAWLVVVLMARELAVTGLRAIASQQGLVIAAGAGGKAKTALQSVGIVFLLVHFRYEVLFVGYELDFHEVGIWVLYVSLVMSVLSAAEYFAFFAEAAQRQAAELAARGLTRAKRKEHLRRRRAKLAVLRRQRRDERRALRVKRREERRQLKRERRRSLSLPPSGGGEGGGEPGR
jgi:CDP-diacylglycerol--glycerol-3-phosphate 3-phosphatidyltransferase